MASEDPNLAGFSSRSRPAPPTLDLKAEEVRSEPASSSDVSTTNTTGTPGEPSALPPAEGSVDAPSAAAPDEVAGAEAPGSKDGIPESETAESNAGQADETTQAEPLAGTESSPSVESAGGSSSAASKAYRPQSTGSSSGKSSSGIGGLMAGLIAGALAGGVVAGGAVYFAPVLGLLPPPPAAPKPVPGPTLADMKALDARIATLEARPAAAPAPSGADAKAVAALGERLGGLEKSVVALQSDFAALKREREAAAKAAVQAASAAPAVPSAPAAPSPELAASVADLKGAADATRGALGAAQSEIAALKGAQDALKTEVGALKSGQDGLKTEIGAVRSAQDGIQTAIRATSEQTAAFAPRLETFGTQLKEAVTATKGLSSSAAAMVVLGTLKEAILSGRPFKNELAAARAVLGPAAGPLDPYAIQAETGFGSLSALADKLAAQGAAAFAALAPAPVESAGQSDILTRLMSSAESLVKVRPAGEASPSDPRAPLQGAVTALRAGSVEGALAAVKALPQPVQDKLKDVTDTLAARQAAAAATATLYQQSLAAISGKMP